MKQNPLTLGSLFDGIGGFPFAGEIAGIKRGCVETKRRRLAAGRHHHVRQSLSGPFRCGKAQGLKTQEKR